jgi:hypothetical protein
MKMNNTEIRKLIEEKRLRYYEVARAVGINPQTFSGWLQTELTPERKERVIKAIDSFQL